MSRLVFLNSPVGSSGPAGVWPSSGTSVLKEMWTSASIVGYLHGQVSQFPGLMLTSSLSGFFNLGAVKGGCKEWLCLQHTVRWGHLYG